MTFEEWFADQIWGNEDFKTCLMYAWEAAQPKWQPIETAPMDGTVFLGYRGGKVREAFRVPRDDCEMWVFGGSSGSTEVAPQLKPTHWMPLPAPPSNDQVERGR